MSSEARSRRSGGLTRGSSAAAEATIKRAVPVAAPCSARARAAATRKCGVMPRYGSTWSDGSGSTARSTSASDAPSSARVEEARVGGQLLDVLVGRHDEQRHARRRARRDVAAASALAAGVRPAVTGAGRSSGAVEAALAEERAKRERCCGGHCVYMRAARPARARVGTPERPLSHAPDRLQERGPGPPDQFGRREPGRQLHADDAAAARLDDVAADDVVGTPVRALDEHVGLDAPDDRVRRVLVEDRDGVHALERQQDFGALRLRV